MATPMFIVTGFLDSGKTTMIKDTLMEQEWIENRRIRTAEHCIFQKL